MREASFIFSTTFFCHFPHFQRFNFEMTRKQKKAKLKTEASPPVEIKTEQVEMSENPLKENVNPDPPAPDSTPVIQKLCTVCKKPGDKFCSSCKSVYYCSVDHQRSDWKTHKEICPPFLVEYDQEVGNQFIASRNIKAGTIILDEQASLFGPQWTESEIKFGIPNCLTCGIYMQMNKDNRCPQCQWPICSPKCAQNPAHSLNECQIFSQRQIPFPPKDFDYPPHDLCLCITWLRGARLKSQNESAYQRVLTMQHYFVDPKENQILDEASAEVIKKLETLIGSPLDSDEEDYKRIARAKKVNAFAGHLYPNIINTYQNDLVPSSGLYVTAAKANHSCVPNCTWSLGGLLPPDLRIRFRTVIDVKKGDFLTVTYRPSDIQVGTIERQTALRNGYGFVCKCPRCTDPTECGTFVSAIKCQSCIQNKRITVEQIQNSDIGHMLPIDPLNLESDALWRCNNCQITQPSKDLIPFVKFLEKQFEYHKMMFQTSNTDGREVAAFYVEFMKEHKNKLHSNHWIFQRVTMEIIVHLRTTKHLMSLKQLEDFIRYFEYRLNIQDKTTPGISAERAMTFRYMKDVLLTLLARFNGLMTEAEIRNWADYSKKVLTEALAFYKNDINPHHIMQKPKPITEILSQDLQNLEKNVKMSLVIKSKHCKKLETFNHN